ncbi:TonB-dependent receptor [Niveispirillum sp. BGYR6]|uniref:TonB-dependent receptor n=1 Tax=Niveispirillum sp. BGYR6 TaxID=2971249 RepID=UPI0022B96667|nr:TonB-dependent receptor [Niveispirillum sp. BGYR6]MDG5495178.1 TonB-dependent receptor [Niveispirillum sp. BGYR6]
MKRINGKVLVLGLLATTAINTAALAQTAAPASTEPEAFALEEIVVTAQRRSENLQKVAIAITALDPAQLEAKAVVQMADLQSASPSLSITNAGQTQSVNIRGIGLASNSPNATAGVATYVDGLFQPPIVQFNSFYDLAGVEVLRGPQGTLVGSNSTGGAIFLTSRSPELGSQNGYATASYGTDNNYAVEAATGAPISDTMALRVAGFMRGHDSYYKDTGPFHNKAGKLDEKGGRVGLLHQTDGFQALLKVQFNDMQTGGYAYQPIPGTYFASYAPRDRESLSFDTPTSHRERAFITSLELKKTFANDILLRSVSGYQSKTINSLDDIDGSQAPARLGGEIVWDYYANEKQYSQELNLISPEEDRFNWILGGYFQRNDIDVRIHETAGGFPTHITPQNKRTTTGLFAQGNYHLTEKVELQLGGRYSHYKTDGKGDVVIGAGIPGFPPGGLPVTDLSGSYKETVYTGKANVNFYLDDDNLLYVFAARGYKPGGFNSTESTFSPETVWDYEAGWKSTLFAGHIRTQLAAFYNDYSNFQFDILNTATGQAGIQNITDATIKGFEAQLEGQFGDFKFDGGLSFVDSELKGGVGYVNTRPLPPGTLGAQCPPGAPSAPPVCFNYTPFQAVTKAGPNLYSPRWSGNIGAQYTFKLDERTTLVPRLNYAYLGSRYSYIGYSPISDRLSAYGLLSGRITLNRDSWRVELYATNLTDKSYVSGMASSSSNQFYGPPREVGIRVGVEF